MNTLKQFVENYTAITDVDWERISGCFTKIIVERDEVLLAEGTICRHLYFIESGLLRFYINNNGNDVTKFFTDAPYCFTSQVSFTAQKPATENIQAIEKSVIWQITLQQANDLLELKSWSTFIRKLLQQVQSYTEDILEAMQTETAESRYEKMLTSKPALLQRVPLKYLASYFGIAPQSLSRIRKKLTTKSRT